MLLNMFPGSTFVHCCLILHASYDLIRGEWVICQRLDALQILFAFCGVAHCLGFFGVRTG